MVSDIEVVVAFGVVAASSLGVGVGIAFLAFQVRDRALASFLVRLRMGCP